MTDETATTLGYVRFASLATGAKFKFRDKRACSEDFNVSHGPFTKRAGRWYEYRDGTRTQVDLFHPGEKSYWVEIV